MNKFFTTLLTISLLLFFNACKEEEVPLPDNLVEFESAEQGMEGTTKTLTVKVKLSRATDVAVPVAVQLTPSGVSYGTEFSTTPAATNNTLALTIPPGSDEAAFTITRADNVFLSGTEAINFQIQSAGTPVLVGPTSALAVKFTSIVSQGSSLRLNGGAGGTSAVNAVFVDFSNNKQSSVARAAWDLGFYAGSEYRVILNSMTGATAVAVNKTNLAQVTAADTVGVNFTLGFEPAHMALVDDVTGDLTKTVIAAVSATEADNKVYILSRGTSGATPKKELLKIRVLRSGAAGYTLQYAGLNETTFKTITVNKESTYNFNYVSLTTEGALEVEPPKDRWDIVWTGGLYKTALQPGVDIPYYFSDMVFINQRGGVQAAEVLTSSVSYDAFAESHLPGVTFSADRVVIGANWRTATMNATGVRTDRFYLVKDAAGNVYKLKFVNFASSDGGERGYPNIEYKLVKKG
ncbi:hypothetical protein HNQ92_000253 [Rhabdobacter roseus]|uniref:HmuY protein n=1 Tax=Rhabdobacter roseus TaxID=1655419 RepID=A0A840TKP8_9BACT|nr:HmuY family protein [Rhabdobacter roseus]MBB5282132.1 hypothetical protein [Rhabdobacter roseus]